ncbi:MAG: hypothetical protein QHH09_01900 [Microgenomates group bacterium]|nr:hypothetical protein [Microgenomates group bacterium]
METLNYALVVKKIYESGLYLFNNKTLKDIIESKKESTYFKYLSRLIKEKILIKIERDKYILAKANISDFELANFLLVPSYISFETALNFWGVISQFPYEITSATIKKTRIKKYGEKIFSYSRLSKNLFFGYELINNYLIANLEKALLDQLYFVSKGIKKINFEELDLSKLKKTIFKEYLENYPKTRQFLKIIKELSKKTKII